MSPAARHLLFACALAPLLAAAPAWAEETANDVSGVTVTGRKGDYNPGKATTATKIDAPLRDIPQRPQRRRLDEGGTPAPGNPPRRGDGAPQDRGTPAARPHDRGRADAEPAEGQLTTCPASDPC